jgi:hypothetical protein
MAEYSPKERQSFNRALSHLKAGAFHRWAGVPEVEKIPESKVQEGMRSDNPHVRKMAHFAQASAGWHHGKQSK